MKLHEQLQVSAELIGRPLSDLAITVLARELGRYPAADVRAALDRVIREAPRALTLAEITRRLPGAHLSADEAWALASAALDEHASVVWTDEIAEAFGVARRIPDRVAARMAFKSAYERLVGTSPGRPQWNLTAGFDRDGRTAAVQEAIAAGRLESGDHMRLLGSPPPRRLTSGSAEPRSLASVLDELPEGGE